MLRGKVSALFKHIEPMPQIEVDRLLGLLSVAFKSIQSHSSSELSFEELYRAAYNLIINKHGMKLYRELDSICRCHLAATAARISKFEDITQFLDQFLGAWNDHSIVMRMIGDVLMYMDKNFAFQNDLPNSREMGNQLFQSCVIEHQDISEKLISSLLDVIDNHRSCDSANASIINSIVGILVVVSKSRGCNPTYSEKFLPAFYDRTRLYYKQKSAQVSIDGFISYGVGVFRFESKLIHSGGFTGESEWTSISGIIEEMIIRDYHVEVLDKNFFKMLNEGTPNLRDSYELFSRTKESKQRMIDLFQSFCENLFTRESLSVAELIEHLTNRYSVCAQYLDRDFTMELRSVVEAHFARDNGIGISKGLSEHIDRALRRDPTEKAVEDSMLVFRHISSKDIFEAFHRKFLCRRLLSGSNARLEAELNVINKLKLECGASYCSKLEGMVSDIVKSGEIQNDWTTFNSTGTECVLEVKVLASSLWSWLKSASSLRLNEYITNEMTKFEGFYNAKFSGRKITWIHSQGTVDVRMQLTNTQSSFLLTVSPIQASILLLFNTKTNWPVKEICDQTGLPVEEFQRHLLSLSLNPKARILTRKSDSGKAKTVDIDDEFQLIDTFDSKQRHVRVPLLLEQASGVPEMVSADDMIDTGHGVEQLVDEDRKHSIEAAIVRVMKTRKQLDHNGLVIEVTKMLNPRFTPSIQMIKSRIDNLIDREFIARDNDDLKLYYYVA
jgi:cullin 3